MHCAVCTLDWSDIALLAIFENGHIAANQVSFYKFNSQKSTSTPCVRVANAVQFSFSKNHSDPKNYYFLKIRKFLPVLSSTHREEHSRCSANCMIKNDCGEPLIQRIGFTVLYNEGKGSCRTKGRKILKIYKATWRSLNISYCSPTPPPQWQKRTIFLVILCL